MKLTIYIEEGREGGVQRRDEDLPRSSSLDMLLSALVSRPELLLSAAERISKWLNATPETPPMPEPPPQAHWLGRLPEGTTGYVCAGQERCFGEDGDNEARFVQDHLSLMPRPGEDPAILRVTFLQNSMPMKEYVELTYLWDDPILLAARTVVYEQNRRNGSWLRGSDPIASAVGADGPLPPIAVAGKSEGYGVASRGDGPWYVTEGGSASFETAQANCDLLNRRVQQPPEHLRGGKSTTCSRRCFARQNEPSAERELPPPSAEPTEQDQLAFSGLAAFSVLIGTWTRNFDAEDAVQPDRPAALMTAFTGYGREINAYIRQRGGLAGAVINVLLQARLCEPDAAVKLGKRIALNMLQVGTAQSLPLDGLIERSLMSSREAQTDDSTPSGGLTADTVDMTRPTFK